MIDKVVILGISRGGTTYLRQLIQMYWGLGPYQDEYGVFNEELNPMYVGDNIENFYSSVKQKINDVKSNCIVKDHIQHYTFYKNKMGSEFPFNEWYSDFYKIKLLRTNIKNTSLSVSIAKETKQWFNMQDIKLITVDPNQYRKDLDSHSKSTINLINFKSDFDMVIDYDELGNGVIPDQKKFPDLFPIQKDVNLTIKKRPPYDEVIENINELYDVYNSWVDDFNLNNKFNIVNDKITLL